MTNHEKQEIFNDVIFDKEKKTMKIIDGTVGTYHYPDIIRCAVLNEKASHRGKDVPFTAVVPRGMGISGILTEPYLYVGIKVIMKDETILAIYVSKEKTLIGTDQYTKDSKEANEIKSFIDKIIAKYQSA